MAEESPQDDAFDLLYRDETCEVRADLAQLATAERILLTFPGIGQRFGAEEQGLEFVGTASRQGAPLFVFDRARSWGNQIDFAALQQVLAPHLEGREVFTLGNSMGGFLAILATSFFKTRAAIAFAPQFSVHPEVMPDEKRWARHRAAIRQWRYRTAREHFHAGTTYYLFFGDHKVERRQYRPFPTSANVHRIIFPEEGHSIARILKEKGLLNEVIEACLDVRFTPALIAGRLDHAPFRLRVSRRNVLDMIAPFTARR